MTVDVVHAEDFVCESETYADVTSSEVMLFHSKRKSVVSVIEPVQSQSNEEAVDLRISLTDTITEQVAKLAEELEAPRFDDETHPTSANDVIDERLFVEVPVTQLVVDVVDEELKENRLARKPAVEVFEVHLPSNKPVSEQVENVIEVLSIEVGDVPLSRTEVVFATDRISEEQSPEQYVTDVVEKATTPLETCQTSITKPVLVAEELVERTGAVFSSTKVQPKVAVEVVEVQLSPKERVSEQVEKIHEVPSVELADATFSQPEVVFATECKSEELTQVQPVIDVNEKTTNLHEIHGTVDAKPALSYSAAVKRTVTDSKQLKAAHVSELQPGTVQLTKYEPETQLVSVPNKKQKKKKKKQTSEIHRLVSTEVSSNEMTVDVVHAEDFVCESETYADVTSSEVMLFPSKRKSVVSIVEPVQSQSTEDSVNLRISLTDTITEQVAKLAEELEAPRVDDETHPTSANDVIDERLFVEVPVTQLVVDVVDEELKENRLARKPAVEVFEVHLPSNKPVSEQVENVIEVLSIEVGDVPLSRTEFVSATDRISEELSPEQHVTDVVEKATTPLETRQTSITKPVLVAEELVERPGAVFSSTKVQPKVAVEVVEVQLSPKERVSEQVEKVHEVPSVELADATFSHSDVVFATERKSEELTQVQPVIDVDENTTNLHEIHRTVDAKPALSYSAAVKRTVTDSKQLKTAPVSELQPDRVQLTKYEPEPQLVSVPKKKQTSEIHRLVSTEVSSNEMTVEVVHAEDFVCESQSYADVSSNHVVLVPSKRKSVVSVVEPVQCTSFEESVELQLSTPETIIEQVAKLAEEHEAPRIDDETYPTPANDVIDERLSVEVPVAQLVADVVDKELKEDCLTRKPGLEVIKVQLPSKKAFFEQVENVVEVVSIEVVDVPPSQHEVVFATERNSEELTPVQCITDVFEEATTSHETRRSSIGIDRKIGKLSAANTFNPELPQVELAVNEMSEVAMERVVLSDEVVILYPISKVSSSIPVIAITPPYGKGESVEESAEKFVANLTDDEEDDTTVFDLLDEALKRIDFEGSLDENREVLDENSEWKPQISNDNEKAYVVERTESKPVETETPAIDDDTERNDFVPTLNINESMASVPDQEFVHFVNLARDIVDQVTQNSLERLSVNHDIQVSLKSSALLETQFNSVVEEFLDVEPDSETHSSLTKREVNIISIDTHPIAIVADEFAEEEVLEDNSRTETEMPIGERVYSYEEIKEKLMAEEAFDSSCKAFSKQITVDACSMFPDFGEVPQVDLFTEQRKIDETKQYSITISPENQGKLSKEFTIEAYQDEICVQDVAMVVSQDAIEATKAEVFITLEGPDVIKEHLVQDVTEQSESKLIAEIITKENDADQLDSTVPLTKHSSNMTDGDCVERFTTFEKISSKQTVRPSVKSLVQQPTMETSQDEVYVNVMELEYNFPSSFSGEERVESVEVADSAMEYLPKVNKADADPHLLQQTSPSAIELARVRLEYDNLVEIAAIKPVNVDERIHVGVLDISSAMMYTEVERKAENDNVLENADSSSVLALKTKAAEQRIEESLTPSELQQIVKTVHAVTDATSVDRTDGVESAVQKQITAPGSESYRKLQLTNAVTTSTGVNKRKQKSWLEKQLTMENIEPEICVESVEEMFDQEFTKESISVAKFEHVIVLAQNVQQGKSNVDDSGSDRKLIVPDNLVEEKKKTIDRVCLSVSSEPATRQSELIGNTNSVASAESVIMECVVSQEMINAKIRKQSQSVEAVERNFIAYERTLDATNAPFSKHEAVVTDLLVDNKLVEDPLMNDASLQALSFECGSMRSSSPEPASVKKLNVFIESADQKLEKQFLEQRHSPVDHLDDWSIVDSDEAIETNVDSFFSVEEEFALGQQCVHTERLSAAETESSKKTRTRIFRTVGEDGEVIEKEVIIENDDFVSCNDEEESLGDLSEEDKDDQLVFVDSEDTDTDNVARSITVFTSTIENEPDVETEMEEYEEYLPDGTLVRRKITTNRLRHTITKRVVLEGLDEDDDGLPQLLGPYADDSSQKPSHVELAVSGNSNSELVSPGIGDGRHHHLTRYADRSFAEPELSTEVNVEEDKTPDGQSVKRRTTTKRRHQLTTERLVVTGDRPFDVGTDEDGVFESLKGLGSPGPKRPSDNDESTASDAEIAAIVSESVTSVFTRPCHGVMVVDLELSMPKDKNDRVSLERYRIPIVDDFEDDYSIISEIEINRVGAQHKDNSASLNQQTDVINQVISPQETDCLGSVNYGTRSPVEVINDDDVLFIPEQFEWMPDGTLVRRRVVNTRFRTVVHSKCPTGDTLMSSDGDLKSVLPTSSPTVSSAVVSDCNYLLTDKNVSMELLSSALRQRSVNYVTIPTRGIHVDSKVIDGPTTDVEEISSTTTTMPDGRIVQRKMVRTRHRRTVVQSVLLRCTQH